tara:strand:- start:3189 stop:3443 length:255 start_codon:yes stop_codon:yes gene_type:complete
VPIFGPKGIASWRLSAKAGFDIVINVIKTPAIINLDINLNIFILFSSNSAGKCSAPFYMPRTSMWEKIVDAHADLKFREFPSGV